MRCKAYIHENAQYKKAITYETSQGVYLFLYDGADDRSCVADYWFETCATAHDYVHEVFGVVETDWLIIADPLPGMQHDWEHPTRAMRHADGKVEFVAAERALAPISTAPHSVYGTSLDRASATLITEVQALIRDGLSITAIKHYKEMTHSSLREAKAIVERLIDQMDRSEQ